MHQDSKTPTGDEQSTLVPEELTAQADEGQNEAEQTEHNETEQENAQADIETLQQRIAALEQEKQDCENRTLRIQADYDNYRRRSSKEKEEMLKYALTDFLEQLLPVIDNFDRAIETSKETEDLAGLVKGIEMIKKQFDQLLDQEGVKPIEAVGNPFDPVYHMAVMQVESEDHDEGIIVEELQKGYIYKDKVIRPSMVKVSN